MLEIRLIGAIQVVRDGVTIAVPGRRIRALLAMLALKPGEAVAYDSLSSAIWDDDPPERVRGSMHTYVGRLRRLLGDDVIETRATGYALLLPRDAVDLVNLWDSVQEAGPEGDSAAERDALAAILRRWHAEPFGDVPSDWLARHESALWAERRLQVFERWVDLSFEFGDHRSCLEPLNRQIDHFALREPLWVRLLMALDSVGRTAEALERYEAVRQRLVDELGVDPSPELRAVYGRLLERSDEQVEPADPRPPAVVPHQLPARVRGFIGRDDLVVEMDRALADAVRDGEGAVLALHGLAGSGKTSLALQWAHRMKDEFPDGQLFLDLHGYGPGEPVDTGHALGVLLRGLGVPGEHLPDDWQERAAMFRSQTDGRRLLVVLDNARESEQVRPLLPSSDAVVLVTSRTQLRGLAAREAAYRVRVDPMPPEESIALLRRRSTGDDGTGELRELAELCGHLPVALAVAAERIGRGDSDPRHVSALIAELGDHRSRLEALTSGDDDPLTNVRAVLDWSYRSLDGESARVMRLLGLYTAPAISTGAVAALAGSDQTVVSRAIDRLTDRHLLMPAGDGYYRMHDLVRDYTTEIAMEEPEAERVAATRRLRSWCLHSTANARTTWIPYQLRHPPDLEPGVCPENFSSAREAARWVDTHAGYLLELIETCIGDRDPVGHLLAPFVSTLRDTTQQSERDDLALLAQAEASAGALGDPEGQADCANTISVIHFNRADAEAAIDAAVRARDLYRRAGVSERELRAQSDLALYVGRGGRKDEAVREHDKAVQKAREVASPAELTLFLCNASDAYLSVGRVDDAVRTAEEALASVEVVDEPGEVFPVALENLGEVRAGIGQLPDAARLLHRAGETYRALHMRGEQANSLVKLGTCYRDLDRPRDARNSWERADRILDETGLQQTKDISRAELSDLIESLDEVSDE